MKTYDELSWWERIKLRWHIAVARPEGYADVAEEPDPTAYKPGENGVTVYNFPSAKNPPQPMNDPDPWDEVFLDRRGNPHTAFEGY